MKNKTRNARRVLAIVLIAMQLLALAAIGIQAEVIVISEMTVKKTDAATMQLDGQASAGEAWDKVEWSTEEYKLGSAAIPADSGMRFKSMWTKTDAGAALWFLIEMSDPTLDSTSRAWSKDCVRVFIDEDGVNEDSAKIATNQTNYGSVYACSEFMSYVNHSYSSKGFEYKTEKKLDGSGYVVEVKYTYQNADLAVAGAVVRANVASVYTNAENENNPAQSVWSRDSEKWNQTGLNNKDCFAHAGKLILSDEAVSVPALSSMNVNQAEAGDMVLDGKVTVGEAWDLVDWSNKNYKISTAAVPMYSGMRFKSMWTKTEDGAALWFLIDMDEPTLDATGRAWNQDSVRVYIDEDGVNEDATKAKYDANNYSSYASSEFMSYAPNTMSSKGFEYQTVKKADGSGYVVEVKYTYQNAALAVAGAVVRANVASVFANAENSGNPAQTVWSWDPIKWNNGTGLNNKDCFAHAGTLTLTDRVVDVADVPAMVVGCQKTAVYTNESGKSVCDLRVVGLINSLDYDAAGYKLEFVYQGKTATQTVAINEVYSSLKAEDETLVAPDGTYYLLMKVSNVPADAVVTFTVTPYTQAAGEAELEGTPFAVTYNNGAILY